ncbi:MAG: Spy/CpxP family protein refolding chaperone [Deltaproteobacteria bacterium]
MKDLAKYLKRALPVVVLAVALGGASALAQPSAGNEAQDQGRGKKAALMKELGLSEEQEAQLAQMRQANRAEAKTLREAVQAAQKSLREALGRYDADPATIQTLAAEVKAAQAQMVDHRVASVTQLKTILTAEQFAKLQEKAKERREAFKNGAEGSKAGFGGRRHGGSWGGAEQQRNCPTEETKE